MNVPDLLEAVDLACTESIRNLIAGGGISTRDQWRDRNSANAAASSTRWKSPKTKEIRIANSAIVE